MVFLRPVRGLGILEVLRRLRSRLLRLKKVLIKDLLFGAFVRFGRGLMALRTTSIHFSDLRQKVEDSFSLCNDSFLNGLLSDIFSIAILLGLGTDKRPQAVAE